ncbi:hypothetical protein [Pelagicoccus mobilis]|uniref:Glycosyl hydrolase family 32 N-terminal domain-containing protein n=1 Tax=Pelagicoccus mobilis TaxID=415221 RepID=A0A934VKY8_9BACT|nr:hypothetical protein [Pelagicoccus mobilis]MBK1877191.1 hypothetical protein [Pelagicoccus mobilis]
MKRIDRPYLDDRPYPKKRMVVEDYGKVYVSGDGPGDCDKYGAREASVFEANGTYYLFVDGAGPDGWVACQARSKDLVNWEKMGPALELGDPGEIDSAGACSPWVYEENGKWHMFYLGTPNAGPPPELVPAFPYVSLKASTTNPEGPWVKEKDNAPFEAPRGSYYQDTSSPGFVIKHNDEYLMYFSAAVEEQRKNDTGRFAVRGLSIARTKDLEGKWTPDASPAIPLEEQVENSSIYFEEETGTYYLFTNHIGIEDDGEDGVVEYTDAVWVYWSKDPNNWNPENRSIVIDRHNCTWANRCIGMPSVIKKDGRLAILYDAPEGDSIDANYRHIGLAWADLPLKFVDEN